MNKAELDLLERCFSAQLEGRFYQTKSKLAGRLEKEGYIYREYKTLGRDRFGEIVVSGYILTIQGNFAYCTSDRCKEAKEAHEAQAEGRRAYEA